MRTFIIKRISDMGSQTLSKKESLNATISSTG
jgi:hypothetical protein